MKTFDTFEEIDGMAPCVKKPATVHAKQIHEDFRVNTLEGDYKQGKAGDYLIKGVEGELYINDKDIFEKTYDFKKDKVWNYVGKIKYVDGVCYPCFTHIDAKSN